MDNPEKQSLSIPIAIVLAGAIISIGVYMSGNKNPVNNIATNTGIDKTRDINVRPVISSDNIIGSPEADIVLVEYSDTECPFCKNFHNTLHQLKNEYAPSNKLAWVYRQFPIVQLHSKAPKESEATLCAADQGKFWPYIDRVFEITPSNDGLPSSALPEIASYVGIDVATFNNCLSTGKYTASVNASVKEAQELGANGTPTSFLVLKKALNDKTIENIMYVFAQYRQPDGSLLGEVSKDKKVVMVSGALPYDFMKGIVDIIIGQ